MSSSGSSSNEIIIPPDSSEEWLSGSTIETFLAAYETLEDTASSTFIRDYVKCFRDKYLKNLMNDYFVENLMKSTLVKAYPYPTDPKEKKFKKLQESARKDVERAFGRLKGK
jgi:hypothetical protein